jgi:hypothetical protein
LYYQLHYCTNGTISYITVQMVLSATLLYKSEHMLKFSHKMSDFDDDITDFRLIWIKVLNFSI